jgi:type II secretory ATPase GspE/PulE/Tfp pilus assembly ATPase PilB-like protein
VIYYLNRRARAGPHRPAEVHEAGDARRVHAWVFDATQREACIAHELRDVTVDMAAIKDGFPERIKSILPFRDRRFGMTTMLEDGLKKARAGLTTVEEVLRVIHE